MQKVPVINELKVKQLISKNHSKGEMHNSFEKAYDMQNEKVFILDDDDVNRFLLMFYLSSFPFDCCII